MALSSWSAKKVDGIGIFIDFLGNYIDVSFEIDIFGENFRIFGYDAWV